MNPAHAKRRAPGPPARLLMGHLPEFRRDPLGLMLRASREYGDIVRLRFAYVRAHLVNHPESIRRILVSHHRNFDKNTRSVAKMRAACGESLLTAWGARWQRHRTLIQPFLRREYVEQFAPTVIEATQEMTRRWSEHAAAGRPIEIVSEMMKLLMSIAARIFFSADVQQDAATIEQALNTVLDETWQRLESVIDPAALSPRFQRRTLREAISALDRIVYRILAERRTKNIGDDLLANLLRAHDESGRQFTDTELRDAVLTLLLAGHETTANALAWSFSLVAQHPAVESQVREELASVLNGREFDLASLQRVPAIHHLFAETLRLYPSIWIVERRAVDADQLGGFHIPAGSMVLISPFVLHRHPGFWENPEQFDPSRFAGEVPQGAYLPFGAGPRHCVGRDLAQLIAPLVLAVVLAKFRLRQVPGHVAISKPGITLRHVNGLPMILEESPLPAPTGDRSSRF